MDAAAEYCQPHGKKIDVVDAIINEHHYTWMEFYMVHTNIQWIINRQSYILDTSKYYLYRKIYWKT